MHICRRQARNLAWYSEEGDPPNRNPFKKSRLRPTRSPEHRAEAGLQYVKSEGDTISRAEQDRREAASRDITTPVHATTLPSPPGRQNEVHRENVDGSPVSTTSISPLAGPARTGDFSADIPLKRRGVSSPSTETGPDTFKTDPVDSNDDKAKFTPISQLKATVFNSWVNLLLVAAPTGIIVHYLGIDPVVVFIINFIAIIPLAAMLSYATEEIAIRTGETLGGLLNATFGNAVELIVAILALFQNQFIIVQTSLIGSMLSNLLLVLGMCFFFGGLNRLEQNFNVTVAQTASSLLSLAIGSLIIPTAFHAWSAAQNKQIAAISRGTSIILLVVYGAYLFFQLKSHTEIYNRPSEKTEKRKSKIGTGDALKGFAQIGAGISASMGGQNTQKTPLVEPEETEEPQLSFWVALFTLAASTALVALCAEAMVGSIDAITTRGHISESFVGLILLPIVGNAAEHATAVTVAVKDKMDLSIGVAVGSSMQIALLVLPLVVVIGWIAGKEHMTLYFDGFQIAILFVTVLLVNYLIQDGKSNWLEGVLLLTLYIIIAVAAWFYPAKSELPGTG